MTIRVSDLVAAIEPSPTLAVDATANRLRDAGKPVLSLGAGQPDFATPEPICEAAIAAIRAGVGKYTAVEGTAALRHAVVAKLERDNGLSYTPEQIVVSCGAKHSLYNALLAIVNPGDGVLIPSPYWVSYPAMVDLARGVPQVVDTDPARGWKLTGEQLEASIQPNSRVLVLNSPANPTGLVYTRAELEELAEVVRRHDLVVLSDEIYETIVYDDAEHLSFATVAPDRTESTVLVNGVSKAYAMTGWRIGYLAASAEIARAVAKLQSQSTGNAAAVSQAAAVAALSLTDSVVEPMLVAYRARRAAIVEHLGRIPGISVEPPAGTFYAFARVTELMAATDCATSVDLAQLLLDRALVAAVPGSAFGTEGYMRFSFATRQAIIEEALTRIGDLASGKTLPVN